MKYQIINEETYKFSAEPSNLVRILENRGVKDILHYLNVDENDILDPLLLDNMDKGANLLMKHIANNSKTYLQIDSDCDGYTSASIMLNYLHRIAPDYVDNCVSYGLHDGKMHGLNVDAMPEDTEFVIIPDAGSNELDIHAQLKEKGIDILILDHHIADKVTQDAVLINNQTCDYPTKSLCGAAIVYKFCSYLDTKYEHDYANNYLDLTALGLIADDMDLRDFETHELVSLGLQTVISPFLDLIMTKNAYQIQNYLTPIKTSFNIAPMINAITRAGTMEEKRLVFSALLDYKALEEIPSTKRGAAWDMKETRIEQAYRTCTNVRRRQNDARDNMLAKIITQIEEQDLTSNKILAIKFEGIDENSRELTGLIANKLMSTYQQPVLLLREVTDEEGKIHWSGSGRNNPRNGIEDFRAFLQASELIDFAEGHENAFGFSVSDDNFNTLMEYANRELASIEFSPKYDIDIVIDAEHYNEYDLIDIANHEDLWGTGVDQPYFLVKNVKLNKDNVIVRKGNNLVINMNRLQLIKFRATDKEIADLTSVGTQAKTASFIGTCILDSYSRKPEIVIADYEVDKVDYWF